MPVRFKILLLIMTALAASLLSYLYVGTSLIIEDKVSYIYDYTLAEVKSAADKLDSRLQKIASVGSLVASSPRSGQALLDQYGRELGIRGAVVLRPADGDRFQMEQTLGEAAKDNAYGAALAQLGWTPQAFEREALLAGVPLAPTGAEGPGRLPVGVRATDADGKPVAFFTLCELDAGLFKDGGKNYELRLVDGLGRTLLTKPAAESPLSPEAFAEFAKTLTGGSFESGVRDWSEGGRDYIAGYQRLASQKFTVASLISKDTAFIAARQLVTRSLVLGLSILFVATGATLLSVRTLTRRLREMYRATQKVGEGDFSIRVQAASASAADTGGDEVEGLAVSFNAMADKINELMQQTAQKARMEKELETAQAVQSRFFPQGQFEHRSMRLSGRYVPASECGGDWWHYAQIGSKVVVVVGDVTGHGVSAALVTAAAHSTFTLLMNQFAESGSGEVPMETLIPSLNQGVRAAAGGQSTMTFVASIIDLKSGVMTMSNASHPPMYVYRKGGENPLKNFKSMMDARTSALGELPTIDVPTFTYQLEPGDRLFWYTDGIMESRVSDGEKISKTTFLKMLASHAGETEQDADPACEAVMGETLRFFGEGAIDRPDDITLVIATIPKTARFATQDVTNSSRQLTAA